LVKISFFDTVIKRKCNYWIWAWK